MYKESVVRRKELGSRISMSQATCCHLSVGGSERTPCFCSVEMAESDDF